MRYIHIYARMNLKFWSFSLNFFPFFKIKIIGLCRSISLYVSLMRREKRSFQVRIKVVKADPLFKNELKWKRGESCKYFNRYRLNLKKKNFKFTWIFISSLYTLYIYISYEIKLRNDKKYAERDTLMSGLSERIIGEAAKFVLGMRNGEVWLDSWLHLTVKFAVYFWNIPL